MVFALKRIRRARGNKGQMLVEVTLIIPLLILLVGAALDWGLFFLVSHVVQNAVREGARAAVTKTSMTEASIESVVQDKIPDALLFASYRSAANIGVSCAVSGGTPVITVSTTGNFSYIFMRLVGLTSVPITRRAEMYAERDGSCPAIT